MIARARANAGPLWLLAATTVANVLGFGYQLVMARLLTAEQYAILIALFGVLILESISSQVIQSATAKLTAQYRARGDEPALHQFVRRWALRVAVAMSVLALAAALRRRHATPERTTLLSPFDNLIINRTRTEVLFGMRYRIEIYVPKHLRVRGFWAMPIVHGAELIGTVDPKVDREHGRLEVQRLHLERDAPRDRSTRRAVEAAVEDLASFVGATEVTWPKGIASSYSRR